MVVVSHEYPKLPGQEKGHSKHYFGWYHPEKRHQMYFGDSLNGSDLITWSSLTIHTVSVWQPDEFRDQSFQWEICPRSSCRFQTLTVSKRMISHPLYFHNIKIMYWASQIYSVVKKRFNKISYIQFNSYHNLSISRRSALAANKFVTKIANFVITLRGKLHNVSSGRI